MRSSDDSARLSGRRPARRSVIAWMAAAAAIASSGAGRAQCVKPAGDTGFAEIIVNAKAGTFDDVLQFDVPVRLCGTAPDGTQKVFVRYAGARFADLGVNDKCSEITGAQAAADTQHSKLSADFPGSLDGTTFRVVLPRLEAERYYVFCFDFRKMLTAEQKQAFEQAARAAIDEQLRGVASGSLSCADSQRLHAALRASLLAAAGADRVITPGTLFDEPIPAGGGDDCLKNKKLQAFDDAAASVLAPQILRQKILAGDPASGALSYAELQQRLSERLRAVAGHPLLHRVSAGLEAKAQGNPNLHKLLRTDLAEPLALAHRSGAEMSRLAMGQSPAEESKPLDEVWEPRDAAAAAGRYDGLSKSLDRLSALVDQTAAAPATSDLRVDLAPAGQAEITELKRDLAAASGLAFTLSGQAQQVGESLVERNEAREALVAAAKAQVSTIEVANGSTVGNFATAQNYYISADTGIVYAPQIDTGVTYLGANFYLRPVNKDAPLRQLGTFAETFPRRFAFTLGLTVQSIADGGGGNPQTRDNLFGNQALVVGAGVRVTDMIRLGTGALVFRKKDSNPLISRFSTAATYYFTASFDLNVAKSLGGLFK